MNAIVTGGTKGIGKAICLKLAANNCSLAVCARNWTDLQNLKNEIAEKFPGVQVVLFKADLEKPKDVLDFADFVNSEFKFVDILINNAGIFIPSAFLDEDENAFEKQMQINLNTPVVLSRIFGLKMRDQKKGHIFNICSVASLNPAENAGSYSVTKFALLGLTKVLRMELKSFGVKVTAVLPGSTLTASWEGTTIPADKFVKPDDVADAIVNTLKMSPGANVDEIIITPLGGDV
ncbi:MAG: SDR family oxidoreductase [Daejeonella sp.]